MQRKIVQTIILLLLLVVFPLVSWIYLRDGLNYRLNVLEELKPKSEIPSSSDFFDTRAIQILYSNSRAEYTDRLAPIMEHFSDQGSMVQFKNFDYQAQGEFRDSLLKVWEGKYPSASFSESAFLADTSNQILHCYRLDEIDDVSALAEHIAFIIPRDPEKDFEYRPEKEK